MRPSRPALVAAVFSAGVWLSFFVPGALLFWSADRGLEMTDEASYLLVAQDPWSTCGHGTFFGFALHPLWQLAGERVATFRQLGYLLGVGMALILGRALEHRLFTDTRAPPWFRSGLYGSLLVASLGIYVDGIRTVSYNWLAWWGAGLWLAALLRPPTRGWKEWLWTGLGASGWLVLVLGKWGAATVLGLIAGLVLVPGGGGGRLPIAPRFWPILASGFFLLLLAAGLIGRPGLVDTLQAGILISRETGSHGFWLVQKYGWEIFYYLYRLGRAFVWIIPLGWGVWILWKKISVTKPEFHVFGPVVFLLGSGLALARGYGIGGTLAFSKESIIAGGWWLGILWMAWKTGGRSGLATLPWRWISLLLAVPFLLGVGTNTSLADYAGHGTIFILVAGWMAAAPWMSRLGAASWLAVLISVASLQGVRVGTSLEHSYRIGSVWQQTERLRHGPENGSLRVDPEWADFLARLEEKLAAVGFRPGDPVVGISDLGGVVYLAGGRSPGVPWFFGQTAGQKPYTQAVLAGFSDPELARFWVFRSTDTRLPGPVETFWPAGRAVPVPRLIGVVRGRPSDLGKSDLEIYKPEP